MKKALSAALSIMLCFMLSFSVFAESSVIKTVVPSLHEITVTYNDGGYVLYKGEVVPSGSQITVDRFGNADLSIICKNSSHIKSVSLNGTDITESIKNGQMSIDDVNTDIDIIFDFEACSSDPTDTCTHNTMCGKVFNGKELLPEANLEFDYGDIKVSSDKNGAYSVSDIKPGRHIVEITSPDGSVSGKSEFVIAVDSTVSEVSVTKLSDGTQLVTVPSEKKDIKVDFVINFDGSVSIVPEVEETTTEKGVIPEEKPDNGKDLGSLITNNPVITKTGELIVNNPVAAFMIFAVSLCFIFLILFVVRKRKKEKDNEV